MIKHKRLFSLFLIVILTLAFSITTLAAENNETNNFGEPTDKFILNFNDFYTNPNKFQILHNDKDITESFYLKHYNNYNNQDYVSIWNDFVANDYTLTWFDVKDINTRVLMNLSVNKRFYKTLNVTNDPEHPIDISYIVGGSFQSNDSTQQIVYISPGELSVDYIRGTGYMITHSLSNISTNSWLSNSNKYANFSGSFKITIKYSYVWSQTFGPYTGTCTTNSVGNYV